MAGRKKDKRLIRVTVSLDPDDYKEMESLATDCDLSTAWLIRKSMREFLEQCHKEVPIDDVIKAVQSGKSAQ